LLPQTFARPKEPAKPLPAISARADHEIAVSGCAEGRLVVRFG
jgi:hypothetical protein